MYAQVCTRPDIAYIIGMLGRYLSNPEKDHWIAAKRVMRTMRKYCSLYIKCYNNCFQKHKSKKIIFTRFFGCVEK